MEPVERWRVPVRVDFAGGTLDLWPIYTLLEGCVTVNAAVDLWIEIEVQRIGQGHRLASRDLGLDVSFASWPSEPPPQLSWIWRVLNALPERPAVVSLHSPVPQGSGLGASSCMGVGLVGSTLSLPAGEKLAAQVPLLRHLESGEIQAPAGWQDYYPAALGGALALHWDGPEPRWERLVPHPGLMDQLLVFYTGRPHHSGLTNWEAYRRFMERDVQTRQSLSDIRDIARDMAVAVCQDPAAVGELLEREGQARVSMSPAVETDAMRGVRDRGRREGWFAGMKPCGAGGGGCCLLVVREGRREEAIAALQDLELPALDVKITPQGLHQL